MPATRTYYERKAQGVCPKCQGVPEPGFVYCTPCRKDYWQRYHQEKVDAHACASGPNLIAADGQWHPVRGDS